MTNDTALNTTLADALSRIARLEEHVAHQQKTIDEMSDQLASQWTTIDQMKNKFDRLVERFVLLESQSFDAPAVTRPPHY